MEWAAAALQPQGSQRWIFDRSTQPFIWAHSPVWRNQPLLKHTHTHTHTHTLSLVVTSCSCTEAHEPPQKCKWAPFMYICLSSHLISLLCRGLVTLKCAVKMCYFHPHIMYCTNKPTVSLANCWILNRIQTQDIPRQTAVEQITLEYTHRCMYWTTKTTIQPANVSKLVLPGACVAAID